MSLTKIFKMKHPKKSIKNKKIKKEQVKHYRKVAEMKIEIVENIKEKMKMDNKYVKGVIAGRIKVDKKGSKKTIIVTPYTFAKIFSPERIRLMLKVKRENVENKN